MLEYHQTHNSGKGPNSNGHELIETTQSPEITATLNTLLKVKPLLIPPWQMNLTGVHLLPRLSYRHC